LLVKINPGSNIHKDNETRTASAGSDKISILEPKMVEHGRFQCPVCGKIYKAREDYDSHALSEHPREVTVEPP
jgi:hypothetical protein